MQYIAVGVPAEISGAETGGLKFWLKIITEVL
jgi:hypothetical protein